MHMLRNTARNLRRASRGAQLLQRAYTNGIIDPRLVTNTEIGTLGDLEYRVFFKNAQGKTFSPWHDLEIGDTSKGIFTMVNEIPKLTRAKFEVATKETFNPIKQDEKKGKPRFYAIDPVFNYGCIPRTWESPDHLCKHSGLGGDNDPVDVVEIGQSPIATGALVLVKPLGILCLLDEGEVDWKVIAIRIDDPMAPALNDISDLERILPGRVSEIREWFRSYKIPDGKPENKFAFDGECRGKMFALDIIEDTYKQWENLVAGRTPANGLVLPN